MRYLTLKNSKACILDQLHRFYQNSAVRMAGLKSIQEVVNDPQLKLAQRILDRHYRPNLTKSLGVWRRYHPSFYLLLKCLLAVKLFHAILLVTLRVLYGLHCIKPVTCTCVGDGRESSTCGRDSWDLDRASSSCRGDANM